MTQELLTALTVITSKKPFCVSPSQPFISLVTQQALCLWVVMGREGEGEDLLAMRDQTAAVEENIKG